MTDEEPAVGGQIEWSVSASSCRHSQCDEDVR